MRCTSYIKSLPVWAGITKDGGKDRTIIYNCLYTKDLRSPVEGLGVTAQAKEVTRLEADTSE